MQRLLLLLGIAAVSSLQAQPPCDHALSFPGFNSYVDCGPGANFHAEGQLTVEAWINLPNTQTNQKIAGNIDPFTNSGFELGIQNGGLYCEVKDTLGLHAFTATSVPAGVWTHVAFTYRVSGRFRGFVNGIMVADEPATNQMIGDNGTTNFRIGAAPWDPNYFVANGLIDEVRVWDIERTQSQLREHMRVAYAPPVPGLIGYWKLSEGTGTATADLSGYNHNGTLLGVTLPAWQIAEGPYGAGTSDLRAGNGVFGVMDFPSAGAELLANITPTSDTFVVSRINCEPGGTPPSGAAVFNNGYWIVDRYGSVSPISLAVTFHFPSGTVSASDSVLPSNLLLFNRGPFSTTGWINTAFAGAASPTSATATFPFISALGQFKVGSNGNSSLDVNEFQEAATDFSVFPNPVVAGNDVMIRSTLEGAEIRIVDGAGRTVRTLPSGPSLLPAGSLAPGVYQVLLLSPAKVCSRHLLVTGN